MSGWVLFFLILAILCLIPSAEDRERAKRFTELCNSIDLGREAMSKEFNEYISNHVDEVAQQLAALGFAMVPTSFGNYTLTLADLNEMVDRS